VNIYQLKINLRYLRPVIWRRIQVPADIKLHRLHDVLQLTLGWEDSHLHQFTVKKIRYGWPDPDFPSDIRDERKFRLDQLAGPGDTLMYEYDFGDGWLHEIKIEKSLPTDKARHYPYCLAGKRACPPEDCGGIPGYQRLLKIIRNPKHREYEEMLDWIGEDFDPDAFDLVATNQMLWRLR
jgi:hypothetical protein